MYKQGELPNHLASLLGKIFYAAAKADNVIKPEEINKLNQLIDETWSHNETISDTFYHCINVNHDDTQLINEVKAHKEAYAELFNSELVEDIMKTAYKIVASSSGTNKSEIVFISQLRNELTR